MALMLVVRFLFAAVQTGGQIIGFQMGFSMINVIDPLTGQQVVVTSHFLYMTTLLTFLALNGHLYLLQGLADSFALVPPGGILLGPALGQGLLRLAAGMFTLGVKIAAPVMAALFLVDLALALIGRAAPQMHVLILGFPIKIAVGFFFLGILFTTLARHVGSFILDMGPTFRGLLAAMS
jgi:flagellar biosynthetic protein FliR